MGQRARSRDSTPAGSETADPAAEGLRTLRIALLVDSLAQPAWARKLIADIQASPFARIALVVRHGEETSRRGLLRRLWRRRRCLVHDLYARLDARIFRQRPDAFAVADAGGLLRGCPVLEVRAPAPAPEDLARIRAQDLDAAVVLAPGLPEEAYAPVARHGVWSLGHDARGREALPGLVEVLRGEPTTVCRLEVRHAGAAAPRVVYRSYAPTDHVSVRRNRNALAWKGAALVLRKLRDLAREGPPALADAPGPPDRPPSGAPANLATAWLLVRLACRYARGKLRALLAREQWYCAYRFEDASTPPDTFDDLIELMPPKDRFWADPFPFRTADGRTWIFFEELCYRDWKGRILAVEIDAAGRAGRPVRALERPYHLSYPQVFEWQGTCYMLPETSQNRKVTLFRCVSFPDRWVEERDLLRDVEAVDATVAEIDGRWWMFANVAPFGAGNRDELHLFHADTPLGPWTPHAHNPVKSDCREARPAGALFHREGRLYRPAQNCGGAYGSSIVVHRVDVLTPDAYHETPVAQIVPTWDRKALRSHTFNRCGNLLVLDLMRWRRRFP